MRLNLNWRWYHWQDLDPDTLYAFLRLRVDAFVTEQNCAFSELDGLDPRCEHLCAYDPAGPLLGYLRLLPPGLKSRYPGLGRLVVAPAARSQGLARALLQAGVRACHERYPEQDIAISAQQHLEDFYRRMGFEVGSKPYLEDDIWHVDMRKAWTR